MKRGDIYHARLNPTEGSEQSGLRPVVIVSRDAINDNSPVIIVVPLISRTNKTRVYPSHVILQAGEGNLTKESIALGEQVRAVSKTRLGDLIGRLAPESMAAISAALKIALDL